MEDAENVLAIELLAAAEGLEFRRPLKAGVGVERAFTTLRGIAPRVDEDRALSTDIERVAEAIRNGKFDSADETSMTEKRTIRAPRGNELSCKGWHQEAALRMLMNNLDPEVAEDPDKLIVYGGTGRAARSWEAFDAIVRSLRELENDETLLVQSGKPVGIFRTHDEAPRVLIANSNLVGQWSNYPEFNRLEKLGLTMYGQMTAGSWIYIASQGIVQGTFETFSAAGERHFGGSLEGKLLVTGGLGGMGGAQPLAATMAGALCLGIEVDPTRIEKRLQSGYCDKIAHSLDEPRRSVARKAHRQRSRLHNGTRRQLGVSRNGVEFAERLGEYRSSWILPARSGRRAKRIAGRVTGLAPERCRACSVEERHLTALHLAHVPVGSHQRKIRQCHVSADVHDVLRVPERKGVVVARGDQDAVRLDRLQHVDRIVAREGLMVPRRADPVAEEWNERQRQSGIGTSRRSRSGPRAPTISTAPRYSVANPAASSTPKKANDAMKK